MYAANRVPAGNAAGKKINLVNVEVHNQAKRAAKVVVPRAPKEAGSADLGEAAVAVAHAAGQGRKPERIRTVAVIDTYTTGFFAVTYNFVTVVI